MNPLGTIKQFEDLIKQGYGYSQLCEKLNLTQDDIKNLVVEYPAFALVIKSRYGIEITGEKQEQPKKRTKSLKSKEKTEDTKESSNGAVTNAQDAIPEGE